MAVEGEEAEYESDPEDAPLPSMRRREASDDEDGERSDGELPGSRAIGSDAESDGQGAAQVYEDEDEFDEEEFEAEDEEEEGTRERGGRERGGGGAPSEAEVAAPLPLPPAPAEAGGDGLGLVGEPAAHDGESQVEEEVKKENEPYAVPTAGAFYMHDDRFRENGRGRHKRFLGGQRLWESRDDRAWVHDRFEELNLQDARHDEGGRASGGRFRGRGGSKAQRGGRGYIRGQRSQAYDDNRNQNRAPKSVRGRGPRRYETLPKNRSEISVTANKQYKKLNESTSNSSTTRQTNVAKQATYTSNLQTDLNSVLKHVSSSSLSSASPPFYPSGSSNQDASTTQKKDTQTRGTNRTRGSSVQMEENLSPSQFVPLMRGKATIDSAVHDRVYIDDTIRSVSGKSLSTSQLQTQVSSLSNNAQSSFSRAQGRGATLSGVLNYQQSALLNQVSRVPSQTHPMAVPQRPLQALVQPAVKVSTQQMIKRPGSTIPSSSQDPSPTLSEVGEAESPPGSSKFKITSVEKGHTSNQGTGSSLLYSGGQVIGATGAMNFPHGDQGFPATPALLPVMQFGGQHGVPAVGMALPGYVAQPQLGFGNSEMTWLPVLTGASGALGASYPYLTLDSSHYARPSGQTSSVSSSRETSPMVPGNTLQAPQLSEIATDGSRQRQSKPRRYSEMNFGQ